MKLDKLTQLKKLTLMSKLTAEQVRELQKGLAHLGYPVGTIDGNAGPNTRMAWRDFLTDAFSGDEILIGNDLAEILQIKLDEFDEAEEERKKKDEDKKKNDFAFKLELLSKLKTPLLLGELGSRQIEELQTAFYRLGYPVGKIDGLIGRRTKTAWAIFKTDIVEGNPETIGPISVKILQEKLNKIGKGRTHDFSTVEGTIEAIRWECEAQGIGLPAQIAYVLATVEWETAKTFKPVREAFFLGDRAEEWRRKNLNYYPFYGRGFVQLTWRRNYQIYSEILEKDFVGNPDGVLNENISLFILVHGFKTGVFTGRKITDYINDRQTDFVEARRGINGTDRAHDIAHLALKYLTAI